MKARVKNTGEIVEINESSTIYDAALCHIYKASELESVLNTPDYWTRLEHQAAIAAMQGMLSSGKLDIIMDNSDVLPEGIAIVSRDFAHALVEELKEKEERK